MIEAREATARLADCPSVTDHHFAYLLIEAVTVGPTAQRVRGKAVQALGLGFNQLKVHHPFWLSTS